jgi:hypothetical protein
MAGLDEAVQTILAVRRYSRLARSLQAFKTNSAFRLLSGGARRGITAA